MFESVYREMLRLTAYGPADKALRRDYTERLSCCTLHVGLDDLWVLTRTETVPGVSAAGPPPDARFSQLTNPSQVRWISHREFLPASRHHASLNYVLGEPCGGHGCPGPAFRPRWSSGGLCHPRNEYV